MAVAFSLLKPKYTHLIGIVTLSPILLALSSPKGAFEMVVEALPRDP